MDTVELADQGLHLFAGEHHRQSLGTLGAADLLHPRQVDTENLAIQEQQGRQGLVLGGRRHPALRGEPCQEGLDLQRTHRAGMALAVGEDEAADPADVGLLRAERHAEAAHACAGVREQLAGTIGLERARLRAGFRGERIPCGGVFPVSGIHGKTRPQI